VNFKGEDEADGEEIGPVFITADDPEFVHEFGWMKISDARRTRGRIGTSLQRRLTPAKWGKSF
jgi:hypothetical protein